MSEYLSLAPFYDELTADVPYNAFADFYEALFRRCKLDVKTILDLACGTGTLTSTLTSRGYEMIGVDASSEMLAVAADKSAGSDLKPLYLCQKMQDLDLFGTVDAVICSLDGINYVKPRELEKVFSRIRLFLESGGIFVFDVNSILKLKCLDGELLIDETDNVFAVWRTEFNFKENICFYGMDIFAKSGSKWERSREEHLQYAFEPEKLKEELTKAGFEDIQFYGELNFDAPQDDEMRIFVSARKPK